MRDDKIHKHLRQRFAPVHPAHLCLRRTEVPAAVTQRARRASAASPTVVAAVCCGPQAQLGRRALQGDHRPEARHVLQCSRPRLGGGLLLGGGRACAGICCVLPAVPSSLPRSRLLASGVGSSWVVGSMRGCVGCVLCFSGLLRPKSKSRPWYQGGVPSRRRRSMTITLTMHTLRRTWRASR